MQTNLSTPAMALVMFVDSAFEDKNFAAPGSPTGQHETLPQELSSKIRVYHQRCYNNSRWQVQGVFGLLKTIAMISFYFPCLPLLQFLAQPNLSCQPGSK